eukprot:4982427-Prymnesium_polylepis.1
MRKDQPTNQEPCASITSRQLSTHTCRCPPCSASHVNLDRAGMPACRHTVRRLSCRHSQTLGYAMNEEAGAPQHPSFTISR